MFLSEKLLAGWVFKAEVSDIDRIFPQKVRDSFILHVLRTVNCMLLERRDLKCLELWFPHDFVFDQLFDVNLRSDFCRQFMGIPMGDTTLLNLRLDCLQLMVSVLLVAKSVTWNRQIVLCAWQDWVEVLMVLQWHHVAIVALNMASTYFELTEPFLVWESVSHSCLIHHFSHDLWVSTVLAIGVYGGSRKSWRVEEVTSMRITAHHNKATAELMMIAGRLLPFKWHASQVWYFHGRANAAIHRLT